MSADSVDSKALLELIKAEDTTQTEENSKKILEKFMTTATTEWGAGFAAKTPAEKQAFVKENYEKYKKMALVDTPEITPSPPPPQPQQQGDQQASGSGGSVSGSPTVATTTSSSPSTQSPIITTTAPAIKTPIPIAPAPAVTPPPTTKPAVAPAAEPNAFVKSYDKSKKSFKQDDGTTNKYLVGGCIILAVVIGGGLAYTIYKSQKKVRSEPMLVN